MVPRAAGAFCKQIKSNFIFIYYLLTFLFNLYFQCEGNEITLNKAHEYTRKIKKATKTVLILTSITLFYVIFIQLLATVGVGYKSKYKYVS